MEILRSLSADNPLISKCKDKGYEATLYDNAPRVDEG